MFLKKINFRLNYFNLMLLIIGIIFSFASIFTLYFHYDIKQILDKSFELALNNNWIHHGNLATKVGSIPGSFLTAISGIPLKFYTSPISLIIVLIIFHCLSYFFLWKSAKFINSTFESLYLLIFFWLNPWRVEQADLYNPGFLFLFSTLHFYTYLKMNKKDFISTLAHFLILFFCFQVHFSAIILFFTTMILWLLGQIKIKWSALFLAIFICFISLIPYLIEFKNNQISLNLFQSDAFLGKNLILIYPVIKVLIYFFRLSSMYFGSFIFSDIDFSWIQNTNLSYLTYLFFHFVKWFLALLTFFFSFYVIGKKLYYIGLELYKKKLLKFKNRNCIQKPYERFEIYFFVIFVSLIN